MEDIVITSDLQLQVIEKEREKLITARKALDAEPSPEADLDPLLQDVNKAALDNMISRLSDSIFQYVNGKVPAQDQEKGSAQ